MIYKAQIPLGELRTDNASVMITFGVFLPTAAKALAVNAPTITHHEKGLSVSFPYFVKLLAEGNIMAHSALWSPYHEGDYFPREDLLNDALVANLINAGGSQYNSYLCWLHAKDIAYRKTFELERKDWESLDSIKYANKVITGLTDREELPKLHTPAKAYNDIIEQYYSNELLSVSVR